MSPLTIVLIVILVLVIAACIALYIFGKKAEKKQAAQREQMEAAAQVISMLIIDKKKMKLKEAGLPAAVIENTPKYLRRTKIPVVSGLYITEIKSVRGGSIEPPQKKKGFFKR